MSEDTTQEGLRAFLDAHPQIEASGLRSDRTLRALMLIQMGKSIRAAVEIVGLRTHQDVARWAKRLGIGTRNGNMARVGSDRKKAA